MTEPFFGYIALHLPLIETTKVRDIATNSRAIYYNPDFVGEVIREDETGISLKGALVHEVAHIILRHSKRMLGRDRRRWNEACDYAVTILLRDAGIRLPKDHLYDEAYRNLAAEQIYETLLAKEDEEKRERQELGGNGGGGEDKAPLGEDSGGEQGADDAMPPPLDEDKAPPLPGEVLDKDEDPTGGEGDGGRDMQDMQDAMPPPLDVDQVMASALDVARKRGLVSAAIERLVEEARHPVENWRDLLRQFIKPERPVGHTWSMPNRRLLQYGLYLPSYVKEGVTVVLAIDTSESISMYWLRRMAEEFARLHEEVRPLLYVIQCDAVVTKVDRYDPAEPVAPEDLKPVGGGGTSFRPVFDYVEEQGLSPDVLVYLTDGEGAYPEQEPAYSVLWLLTQSLPAHSGYYPPFGIVGVLKRE
jgi:predicted metal-dependent peptidase